MADIETLKASLSSATAAFNTLKAQSADKSSLQEAQTKIIDLNKQIAALNKASGSKGDGKKGRLTLKTPKGTKDWTPTEMGIREHIFNTLTRVFKAHGGSTIDTPVFELREILAGKYGEDSKLIYDLQDQGGEICSLRYDLTVPFARFLAMYGAQYPTMKRYHIAKVYRRDAPAMTKGRMREFYQCDFDIAGAFDPMLPDAEILAIVCEALTALEVGEFTVKINHRKILDGIFEVCGVPKEKIRTISSAVDKLDKLPWADVKKEMTDEKGLDAAIADRIGEFVRLKGGPELLLELEKGELASNKTASEGIADMKLLFTYLDVFDITSKMSFDLSLARGLDYYTGVIYEAVVEGSAPPLASAAAAPTPAVAEASTSSKKSKKDKAVAKDEEGEPEVDESQIGVGSIAAGGRYDELVGMFAAAAASDSSSKGSAKGGIPCVGVSVGVERVFSILMQKEKEKAAAGKVTFGRKNSTEVFVMNMGDGLLIERMQVVKELWAAGIKTEFSYKAKPKHTKQFEMISKEQIPFAVIVAPEELKEGYVRVKEQLGKEATEASGNAEGEKIKREDLISWLKARLASHQP